MTSKNIKRRDFISSTAAAATISIVPRHVLGGEGYMAPSDKITVALRAGKKIAYDSANMKITNDEEANKYLTREYRKGWEI